MFIPSAVARTHARLILASLSAVLAVLLIGVSSTHASQFASSQTLSVGANSASDPRSADIGDFDGDSDDDLVVASKTDRLLSLYANNSSGQLMIKRELSLAIEPNDVVFTDADGSPGTDIVVAGSGCSMISRRNEGRGVYPTLLEEDLSLTWYDSTCTSLDKIHAGDMYGDDKQDLGFVDSRTTGHVFYFMRLITEASFPFMAYDFGSVGLSPSDIMFGEYKASSAVSDEVVVLFRGENALTIAGADTYSVGSEPVAFVGADFDTDGDSDIAVANGGSGTISILFGDPTASDPDLLVTRATLRVGNGPSDIETGDFDGDGDADLAVANSDDNTVSIATNARGRFTVSETIDVGDSPAHLTSGNLDNDGRDDLAVVNQSGGDVTVLRTKASEEPATDDDSDNTPAETTATNDLGGTLDSSAAVDTVSSASTDSMASPAPVPATSKASTPTLTLKVAKKLKGRKHKLRIRGKLSTGGVIKVYARIKIGRPGHKRTFKLKRISIKVKAGKYSTLSLSLKPTTLRAIKRAITRKMPVAIKFYASGADSNGLIAQSSSGKQTVTKAARIASVR